MVGWNILFEPLFHPNRLYTLTLTLFMFILFYFIIAPCWFLTRVSMWAFLRLDEKNHNNETAAELHAKFNMTLCCNMLIGYN